MGECQMYKKGRCRFGSRCKYAHIPEQVDLLFSRMNLRDARRTSSDVKVTLTTDKKQELRDLLSISLVNQNPVQESEECDSDSSDSSDCYSSDEDCSRRADTELQKKYSHIPDSIFKQKFMQNIIGNSKARHATFDVMKLSLNRDSALDYALQDELRRKTETNVQYQKMLECRRKLPAFGQQMEILKLIKENQVVVISGETGCGKTTQVAQFILDDCIQQGRGSLCHVVCTQPRRISAISVAQRVSAERDEMCGMGSVGYQIRLEKQLPRRNGSILFCTTGILIQWMQSDPGLTEVSHVIIDEIHERNINSDFLVTIIREIIPKRKDLKVILMSATLNADQFSLYYGVCPTIQIPGHLYPVEVHYLEDVLQEIGYIRENFKQRSVPRRGISSSNSRLQEFCEFIVPYVTYLKTTCKYSDVVIEQLLCPESENIDLHLISELIQYICYKKEGAILVFLPGWELISSLFKILKESDFFCCNVDMSGDQRVPTHSNSSGGEDDENTDDDYASNNILRGLAGKFLILPLHSKMPTVNQSQVFDKPPPGVRKIIISTNIAETSITIDDVVYIIDSGKMKMKNFDVDNNISTLQDEWESKANAKQRKGRAGRVQAGLCYHLFTKARERTMDPYPRPEMLRTRLEELILQIKILQLGKAMPFLSQVMSPPDQRTIVASLKLLQTLNALDEDENLTPLGYHLAKLPLDPQIGKMLLMGAMFSCVDPIFSIAASLSFKDPFFMPLGKDKEALAKKLELSNGCKSDHLVLAEGFRLWEKNLARSQGGTFCRNHFLSGHTLRSLRDLKTEFAEHLHEVGFLSSKYSKDPDANINSHNLSLVRAVVCAGLYPNVAIIERVEKVRTSGVLKISLVTPEDGSVKMHRCSINESESSFESPYMVYHMKLKSSYIFIHDTTMTHSLPLLLFGHNIKQEGSKEIAVNSLITFRCDSETSNLIQVLREQMRQVLDKKIIAPGTFDWNSNCPDTKILRAVVELITCEDEKCMARPAKVDD